ncbi:MAG: class I SAM-dependent methyltransferase [Pseudonocardiales bacterium]|nr:class I SAM-dependent methyltransferase [Pseudonocardiales bacterium]MBV9031915.1 class I SAM-dependent methyltransferase [Pseudonocardiales bacterium]MBW0009915.1 class I SAM-dependent methyltransferase [Pseudonocardiales bacterium]
MSPSLPAGYFEDLYATATDPWGFTTRWYEHRKYACALAALPRARYRRGYEPGCSIGVLTEHLAARCDELLATDVAEAPLRTARARLARSPNVVLERRGAPEDWPRGGFDLLVISELGYYLDPPDLRRLWVTAIHALEPGGTLLAVHWRHPVAGYPQTGDDVHAALAAQPGLGRLVEHVEEDFRLEVYLRTPPAVRSVAAQTGLR